MITYVNNSNAEQYRILYARATRDLMNHNAEGGKVNPGGDAAIGRESIIPIQGSDFGPEGGAAPVYEPYTYYTWDATNKEYVLAAEATPKAAITYYQAPDITSLNEYFSNIEALARINPIYTVLPLDEDTFDIDANTREIKVPKHFKDNGISVQGDEIAEVVYFKINRYFDTIDLSTKDIYIQWRSAAADENGQLIEGVSVPWCVDYESEPNYILFGWPISSKITKAAGEISFAVRFYEFDNDNNQITYSLSTLIQKVQVKQSLDFNILDKFLEGKGLAESTLVLDDNSNLILSRLEDSELTGATVKAEVPEFLVNLNPAGGEPVEDEHHQLNTEAWLALDDEGFRTVPINAEVQATSSDGGRISYSWKKFNIDDNGIIPINYTNKFLPTTDTARDPNKSYYINTTDLNDDSAYKVYPGNKNDANDVSNTFDKEDENYPENGIFERFSSAVIDTVGKYLVSVTNRVQNSTAKIQSYMLYVKRPVKPVIETNLPPRGALAFNAEEDLSYKLTLSIGVSASDHDEDQEKNDNKSKFTYQWQKQVPGSSTWVDIEGATASSYVIEGAEDRIPESELGRIGDGNYRVLIWNNLNRDYDPVTFAPTGVAKIMAESSPMRVTHVASKPVINIEGRTSFNLREAEVNGLQVQGGVKQEAGEYRNLDEDGITYQWYKYQTSANYTTEQDVDRALNGEYEDDPENPNDILIEGATSQTYYPSAVGHYYCAVKNTYNGTEATQISRFFVVTDA